MKESYSSNSQQETEQHGAAFAVRLHPGTVIAFAGELGAGKTAFARGILRGLGYDQPVTSPTFTIVNEYTGQVLDVAHFDMYRVHTEEELYSTGFYDYLDGRFVSLIEWSEHIPWALGPETVCITIEGSGDSARRITIEGNA